MKINFIFPEKILIQLTFPEKILIVLIILVTCVNIFYHLVYKVLDYIIFN